MKHPIMFAAKATIAVLAGLVISCLLAVMPAMASTGPTWHNVDCTAEIGSWGGNMRTCEQVKYEDTGSRCATTAVRIVGLPVNRQAWLAHEGYSDHAITARSLTLRDAAGHILWRHSPVKVYTRPSGKVFKTFDTPNRRVGGFQLGARHVHSYMSDWPDPPNTRLYGKHNC